MHKNGFLKPFLLNYKEEKMIIIKLTQAKAKKVINKMERRAQKEGLNLSVSSSKTTPDKMGRCIINTPWFMIVIRKEKEK